MAIRAFTPLALQRKEKNQDARRGICRGSHFCEEHLFLAMQALPLCKEGSAYLQTNSQGQLRGWVEAMYKLRGNSCISGGKLYVTNRGGYPPLKVSNAGRGI
ncbi:MAG: hypothetical protein V1835_05605 [Candidatus Micrarchaeota archaeon]